MENKFTVSIRRQFVDQGSGLKNSILRTILHKTKQEIYDAKIISTLAQEIEDKVNAIELSEYTFNCQGNIYTFKVDSMDMLIQGQDNVCLQEHSEDFLTDKFYCRHPSIEQYDRWNTDNPPKNVSTSFGRMLESGKYLRKNNSTNN